VSRCFSSRRGPKPSSVGSIPRKQREKDIRDLRNYDRGGEWSPTAEDVDRNWDSWWAEEHTLIWAAHQPSLVLKLNPCRLINPVEAAGALLLY